MTRREYKLADGRILAWSETGSGPPLALLHGWSISGLAFVELAERLASRFRVLLPDLPGHGESSPCTSPGLERFSRDLFNWLDAVSPGPVCLAGWSLGGMVSMAMAQQHLERFSGLVLIGTTPRFTRAPDWPHGLSQGQVKALRRNLDRRFEATLGEFFKLTFAGEEIPTERLQTIRRAVVYPGRLPDPQVAAALLDLLAVQDQRNLLDDLDLPALIIHGEADQVTPVGAAEVLAERLPVARLVKLAGVGHAPFWSQPDTVATLLEETHAWCR